MQHADKQRDKAPSRTPEGIEKAEGRAGAGAGAVQFRGKDYAAQQAELAPGSQGLAVQHEALTPTQTKGGDQSTDGVHAAAEHGTAGAGSSLPHLDRIQASFGRHDVSRVQAYSGGSAQEATTQMRAEAYTTGNKVAFGRSPSLHTAAHEAAHVVQQRAGVSLKGGVGQSGDTYEQHADAVADAVVEGQSAEALLDRFAGGGGGGVQSKGDIQFIGHSLGKALPEGADTPAYRGGRDATDQRRYSPDQYISLWEKQHGRTMSDSEKEMLSRGCIGISAVILGRNPPLDNAWDTFEQGETELKRLRTLIAKHPDSPDGQGGRMADWNVVMFAKMFFSNQQPHDHDKVAPDAGKTDEENYDANMRANRKEQWESDPEAFKPDPTTGRVDMTQGWLNPDTGKREPYKYRNWRPEFSRNPRTGEWEDRKVLDPKTGKKEFQWHVNFDYGFWDEDTQCFWHANHAEPGMHVYQSTKEKFQRGYMDFDRVIYCVAMTKNYQPEKEASGS